MKKFLHNIYILNIYILKAHTKSFLFKNTNQKVFIESHKNDINLKCVSTLCTLCNESSNYTSLTYALYQGIFNKTSSSKFRYQSTPLSLSLFLVLSLKKLHLFTIHTTILHLSSPTSNHPPQIHHTNCGYQIIMFN